jgi:hypothetical protein
MSAFDKPPPGTWWDAYRKEYRLRARVHRRVEPRRDQSDYFIRVKGGAELNVSFSHGRSGEYCTWNTYYAEATGSDEYIWVTVPVVTLLGRRVIRPILKWSAIAGVAYGAFAFVFGDRAPSPPEAFAQAAAAFDKARSIGDAEAGRVARARALAAMRAAAPDDARFTPVARLAPGAHGLAWPRDNAQNDAAREALPKMQRDFQDGYDYVFRKSGAIAEIGEIRSTWRNALATWNVPYQPIQELLFAADPEDYYVESCQRREAWTYGFSQCARTVCFRFVRAQNISVYYRWGSHLNARGDVVDPDAERAKRPPATEIIQRGINSFARGRPFLACRDPQTGFWRSA